MTADARGLSGSWTRGAPVRLRGLRTGRPGVLFTLCLVIATACTWLALSNAGYDLETRFGVRWLYAWRGPLAPPRDMVVISVEDRAEQVLAPWFANGDSGAAPFHLGGDNWPRDLHACLIKTLHDWGARGIVVDVFFDPALEVDRRSPRNACDGSVDGPPTRDLAQAIAAAGNVLLPTRLTVEEEPAGSRGITADFEQQPVDAVAAVARATAAFPLPDTDHRVDQFWTFRRNDDAHARPRPTLATLVAFELLAPQAAAEASDLATRVADERTRALGLQDDSAQTGALSELLRGPETRFLNMLGPPGLFAVDGLDYGSILLAAGDAQASRRLREKVRGRIVFVGASDHRSSNRLDSYFTQYPAPAGAKYGGVELLAMAVANLREGNDLQPLRGWVSALLLVALASVVAGVAWRRDATHAAVAAAVLGFVYTYAAHVAFDRQATWMPVVVPVLVELPLLVLAIGLSHFLRARAIARDLYAIATRYLSPQVFTAHLAEDVPVPRWARCVVFMSDATNFTAMVEKGARRARGLTDLLSEYYAALSLPVQGADPPGTIIDLAGDGMLAVWEAENDERRVRRTAALAACAVQSAVAAYNARHGDAPLPTRIGLHTGDGALGVIPVGMQFAFKLTGDVTNTTSRIESLNRHLGTRLLASAEMVHDLADVLLLRRCGRFVLKGRTQPCDIVEIVCPQDDATATQRAAVHDYEAALALFEQGESEAAARCLRHLLKDHPGDGPAEFLLGECAKPPAGRAGDGPQGEIRLIFMDSK